MASNANGTNSGRTMGRRIYSLGALVAVPALLLLACPGCDDQIRSDVRQGALTILESAVSTAVTTISGEVTSGIQGLGSGTSTTTTTP